MYDFLAQVVFVASPALLKGWARNEDFGGWMRILVIVIVAAVYALSGILKARAKKDRGEEEEEEQEQEPPRPHPAGTATRREHRPAVQPQRPEAVRPEPVVRKPAKAEQAVLTVPKEPQVHPVRKITSRGQAAEETISNGVKPQLAISTPQLEAEIQEFPEIKHDIEELPEFISETVKGLEHKRAGAAVATLRSGDAVSLRSTSPAEIAETTYFGEPLLDVSDPEQIRRAILHYEIFGKPLSLRGPGEQVIGL